MMNFFLLSDFHWENWNDFMINSSEVIVCSQILDQLCICHLDFLIILCDLWQCTKILLFFITSLDWAQNYPAEGWHIWSRSQNSDFNRVSRVTCQKLTSFQNSIGARCIQFHIEFEKHASIHGISYSDFGSNNQV